MTEIDSRLFRLENHIRDLRHSAAKREKSMEELQAKIVKFERVIYILLGIAIGSGAINVATIVKVFAK